MRNTNNSKFGISPGGEIKFYDMSGNLVLENEVPEDTFIQLEYTPRHSPKALDEAYKNIFKNIKDNKYAYTPVHSEKIVHNENLDDFKRAVNIDDYAVCTGYGFIVDGRVSCITQRGINLYSSTGKTIFVKWGNVKYIKKS